MTFSTRKLAINEANGRRQNNAIKRELKRASVAVERAKGLYDEAANERQKAEVLLELGKLVKDKKVKFAKAGGGS